MGNKTPSGEAKYLLEHPLLNELLDGLERDAFEEGASAKPSDDEKRRTAMQKVNAIRTLRQELKSRASGEEDQPAPKVSVA